MNTTEISKNAKAIDLIIASDVAIENEKKAQRWRSELKEMIEAKQQQISEEIVERVHKATGNVKSNIKASTMILLKKAIVYVHCWNFDVEYRDGDLTVNKDNERKCDVKLSEMNEIFNIIKEVVTKEGLE